jgi:flagellar assembly protein FliH
LSSNRIKGQEIQVGDSFVLPIEQSRVTRSQAKVQQILEETDAKAQKIISAAESKSQIITETANTEAARIIEDAKKKAEEEYESIKQQAYQEGFQKGEQDGLNKFTNDAINGLNSLETLSTSSFDLKKNIIDSATRDIIDLVSTIADKVCHQKFDDDVLHKITLDAIKQLNDKETITIIVNPELVDNINSLVPAFREEIPKLKTLKILEDISLSPDGVIVETPNVRLDSRISSQIAEITQKMLTGADDELGQE